MLSVLEYISHFQSQAQWQYKANIGRSSLSLASHYLIFIAKYILLEYIPVSYVCLAFCYLLLSVNYYYSIAELVYPYC